MHSVPPRHTRRVDEDGDEGGSGDGAVAIGAVAAVEVDGVAAWAAKAVWAAGG